MNAAPCSWWQVTNLIELPRSASITSMFSSPGMPKMYSTPSFSRHLTRSSAALCVLAADLGAAAVLSVTAISAGAGMAILRGSVEISLRRPRAGSSGTPLARGHAKLDALEGLPVGKLAAEELPRARREEIAKCIALGARAEPAQPVDEPREAVLGHLRHEGIEIRPHECERRRAALVVAKREIEEVVGVRAVEDLPPPPAQETRGGPPPVPPQTGKHTPATPAPTGIRIPSFLLKKKKK